MVKINFILLFAFLIPVFLASDEIKDPFFDIFEIRKPADCEPSDVKIIRERFSDRKAFFIKEFEETKLEPESVKAQKNLFLEFYRIRLDNDDMNSAIRFMISKIALTPLYFYLEKKISSERYNSITDFCSEVVNMRKLLPFLLTPSEYDEFLGLFKDVKEDQKQTIIDNIQGSLQGSDIWDDGCCSALANCAEIIKMKDEILKKRADLDSIAIGRLRKETSSILAPIREDIGKDMDDESFGKVSETVFNFLFCFHFSNLALFSEKALSDFIFFGTFEDEPVEISEELKIKINSSEESFYDLVFSRSLGREMKDISGNDYLSTQLNFRSQIKSFLIGSRKDFIRLKICEDKSMTELLQILNRGIDLIKTAIKPATPSNPDSKPLQQDPNPPDDSPGRGKIIAAICLIILFILAAVGAGLILYRRQRKI
jgi:hypothetical protein